MQSRRAFLQSLLAAGCSSSFRAEDRVENADAQFVPFVDEDVTFDTPIGEGLDGRLYRNLSDLTDATLVTPNDRFYIRTRTPDRIDYAKPWTVNVVDRDVPIAEITSRARSMGVTLLECSGNARGGGFGLMSAAAWDGIPLLDLLPAGTERVLVNGFDEHSQPSAGGQSTPGASWIFARADLAKANAFLATKMNGTDLPRDHGFPIRLVVPGWYGCTNIKWVDRIALVGDDEPATSQMKEFASRTHQDGVPDLARDYQPAVIDLAAMPVHVERRGDVLRIVGITWGGDVAANELSLSFGDAGPVERFRIAPRTETRTWSLWQHERPMLPPGRYRLTMHVTDPIVRTRRLDIDYYARTIAL